MVEHYDSRILRVFTNPPRPDPLTCADGTTVEDAPTWRARRRPELLELFATRIYGRTPSARIEVVIEKLAERDDALEGTARMREVRVGFAGARGERGWMPPVATPILSTIGYHVRPGGHDMTAVDWAVFLDYADRHLR